jgi:hypothetical protein
MLAVLLLAALPRGHAYLVEPFGQQLPSQQLFMQLEQGSSSLKSPPPASPPAVTAERGWPLPPVLAHPWTRANVGLVYAHELRDGVGAQTMRLLELHSLTRALGLRYLHAPLMCVGHISGRAHYRNTPCEAAVAANDSNSSSSNAGGDAALLSKLRRLVALHSSVDEATARTWELVHVPKLGWDRLLEIAGQALVARKPTLISTEFVNSILQRHPDMHWAVPVLRPDAPQVRVCYLAEEALFPPTRSACARVLNCATTYPLHLLPRASTGAARLQRSGRRCATRARPTLAALWSQGCSAL